jgi:hypothetical protein
MGGSQPVSTTALYLPCKFRFLEFHQNLGRKTRPVMCEGYVCTFIQNILNNIGDQLDATMMIY